MRGFVLSLCGIDLILNIDPCSYAADIENRLLPFLREEAGPDLLRLEIRDILQRVPNADPANHLILPEIRVVGDQLSISQPNYRAEIDLMRKEGAAQTSDSFAAFISLLRGFFSCFLPLHSGFLLHSAGMITPAGVHLFSGASGSGKTTLAREALRRIESRHLLSDELIPVRVRNGTTEASGSPFWGDLGRSMESVPSNDVAGPVTRITFLEKTQNNRASLLGVRETARRLLRHILLRTESTAIAQGALSAVERTAENIRGERVEWKDLDYLVETVSASWS